MLLHRPDFEATQRVDAKTCTILCVLVEKRCDGSENCRQHARLALVLGPLNKAAAGSRGQAADVRDLQRRGPRGREERTRVLHGEPAAAELLLPVRSQRLLLPHQSLQALDVAVARRRRCEGLAFATAVRQEGVEHFSEEALVLVAEHASAFLAIQLGPECAADGQIRIAARRLRGDLGGGGEIELVQVQIHTLWRQGSGAQGTGHGNCAEWCCEPAGRRHPHGAQRPGQPRELPRRAHGETGGRRRHQGGGGPAQSSTACHDGSGHATRGGEPESVNAEVNAAIDALPPLHNIVALARRNDHAVFHLDRRVAAVVPELWDLHAIGRGLRGCELEPRLPQTEA
mmetsp:Transcript_45509/g.130472  ORF Transcript_45509/g.130472 Transcript_45509/m.130472 type:complete len:343 (+) Transcript_45509:735-1763(+)